MKCVVAVLALAAFAAAAVTPKIAEENYAQRIVGGEPTTIESYPYAVSMLHNSRGTTWVYTQWCGATIITSRYVLSAAHCYQTNLSYHLASWWRIRVGSTYPNSGGVVYALRFFTAHRGFAPWHSQNDIAILQTDAAMVWGPTIQPADIAGPSYILPDWAPVTAIGYGVINNQNTRTEVLRHVEVNAVSNEVCTAIYPYSITENMLCTGVLLVGGKDQCAGDSGSPVLHNNVVVGICSWGPSTCGDPMRPGVNTKVSSYIDWIQDTITAMNLLTP